MSTVVFFHAHPDDEALLTGGTMALLADQGHRVVLVTATSGEDGLTSGRLTANGALGAIREAELAESVRRLGCARVELLGYPDSGSGCSPSPGSLATIPVAVIARRLAQILREERAELLIGYDPAGGYGHRDHLVVHHVARAAAAMAGTPRLLEATVDRSALQRVLRVISPATRSLPDFAPARFDNLYSSSDQITHVVPVRQVIDRKRAAMQAHVSQSIGDESVRSLRLFLALPRPLFRIAFGREWYAEVGAHSRGRRLENLLDSAVDS